LIIPHPDFIGELPYQVKTSPPPLKRESPSPIREEISSLTGGVVRRRLEGVVYKKIFTFPTKITMKTFSEIE
jgi:hypothetical protein